MVEIETISPMMDDDRNEHIDLYEQTFADTYEITEDSLSSPCLLPDYTTPPPTNYPPY